MNVRAYPHAKMSLFVCSLHTHDFLCLITLKVWNNGKRGCILVTSSTSNVVVWTLIIRANMTLAERYSTSLPWFISIFLCSQGRVRLVHNGDVQYTPLWSLVLCDFYWPSNVVFSLNTNTHTVHVLCRNQTVLHWHVYLYKTGKCEFTDTCAREKLTSSAPFDSWKVDLYSVLWFQFCMVTLVYSSSLCSVVGVDDSHSWDASQRRRRVGDNNKIDRRLPKLS